jgi:hypothetical protein
MVYSWSKISEKSYETYGGRGIMEEITHSKIRLRIGEIEVEYEGSEAFLKADLPALLETVVDLHQTVGLKSSKDNGQERNAAIPEIDSLSTSTVASKIGGKTGTDLAFAAAVYLAVGLKKEKFTRAEILEQMKAASSYFKKNYIANLSGYLKTLIKGCKLHQVADDTYSLPAAVKSEMEPRLV